LITALSTRGMVAQERDGLKEEFDAEDDKDVATRILAVHYVRDTGIAPELAAEMVFYSASSMYKWLSWHGEGGPGALRDPPFGAPRLAGQGLLGRITGAVSRPYVKALWCARGSAGRPGCRAAPPPRGCAVR